MTDVTCRAIIFDMDGVITDTMPDHFEAWRQVLAGDGLAITAHDVYKREGGRGISGLCEIYEEYGRTCDAEKARALLAQKERTFSAISRLKFIPGAQEFIERQSQKGFHLGLVTGTSRDEVNTLLPDGLRARFEVIVTGSDVTRGKPDPEPYQKALDLLGITADEAVVIENAPFGIQSARACGIPCFGLTTSLPSEFLTEATMLFHSFQEMNNQVSFHLPRTERGHGHP